MATRTKKPKRGRPVTIPEALSNAPAIMSLRERLSSPRLRSPGTLTSYSQTARHFLIGLKDGLVPTDSDFRRYFIRRRKEGISEVTLEKEFAHLKKLAQSSNWPWPFTKEDTPRAEEKKRLPYLMPDEIDLLIKTREKLTRAERFYLAVATTWIVRREELRRIRKRDFDENVLSIDTAKHGRKAKHLIPDVLKPIFQDYTPKEHSTDALTKMFKRILSKAGVTDRKGLGWHGIRITLNTLLEYLLPANGMSARLLNDFSHWKMSKDGNQSRGEDMISHYRRSEIIYTDPYDIDRAIYKIHPFLSLWESKESKKS